MHIVHAIERAEPFPVAEPQVAPLLSLPLELHCVILAHLDLSSLLSVSYTCKTLRNALLHPYAWARICHASDGGSDILEQLEPRSRCRRRRTRHQAAAVCRVYYYLRNCAARRGSLVARSSSLLPASSILHAPTDRARFFGTMVRAAHCNDNLILDLFTRPCNRACDWVIRSHLRQPHSTSRAP